MSPKQTALYWREWQYVRGYCTRRGQPEPDRHALHVKALGYEKSSKEFSNAEFDLVLGVFRSISRPGSVDSQLRQFGEPRARLLAKIREELAYCLGLYVNGVGAYIREIIRDTVNRGSVQAVSDIDDLNDWQLKKLIMDLSRRLNGKRGLRNQAGHTLHTMKTLAGVKCTCRDCAPRGREGLVPAGRFEVEEPF